ncbi:MFS family permease [Bradyrhizobium sp. LM4.3]
MTEEAMPDQPISGIPPVSARVLLSHRAFLFFLLSRSLSRFSSQIAAVAIGWQIYDLTGSAFDLGMVGLVQFLPTALLVFVAGHAADRYERKRVVQLCQLVEAATALYLGVITYLGLVSEVQIFVATFVLGIAGAFESPTTAALLPAIAPQGSLQRATAVSSGAAQVATITGPALGGFAYAVAPHLAYAMMVLFWIFGMILTGFIRRPRARRRSPRRGRTRTMSSPASASSAAIRRSSAPSRSICSRCCSAASPRCCRSMPATSSRPVRWGWGSYAPRPRSARWR